MNRKQFLIFLSLFVSTLILASFIQIKWKKELYDSKMFNGISTNKKQVHSINIYNIDH